MKPVLIYLLFFIMLCSEGCRAGKETESRTAIAAAVQQQKEKLVKTNESGTVAESENTEVSSVSATFRIEFYPPVPGDTLTEPAVKSKEWTGVFTGKKSQKDTNSHTKKHVESDFKSDTAGNIAITKDTKEKISSDTRPVQGTEWIWVTVGIAIVIIVLIITTKKSP